MKKAYGLLFAAYVMLLAFSFAEVSGSIEILSEPAAKELQSEKQLNVADFISKNGAGLAKGVVENAGSAPSFVESINIDGENHPVGSFLDAGSFIQYAKIAGFIIVPNGSSLIDERETSYFVKSGKLKIALASNDASGIYVFVPESIVPVALISHGNVEWRFDPALRTLYVKALEPPMPPVTEIYFGTHSLGTFIEDTEKLETVEYSNSRLAELLGGAERGANASKEFEQQAKNNATEANIALINAKNANAALQGETGIIMKKMDAALAKTSGKFGIDYWATVLLVVTAGMYGYLAFRRAKS